MLKIINPRFLMQCKKLFLNKDINKLKLSQIRLYTNNTFDQSKYNFLISKINEKKNDANEQKQLLEVLVRTLEDERQQMDPTVQEMTQKLLQDTLNKTKEVRNKEIDESCRVGLALLGSVPPLKTEFLRILSVDGGGIRGIIVIELMKRLEELTGKRFFDLFDFICGVSTGSIFVCGMIADKNRTLDEGKEHYKDASRKVFHLPGTLDVLSGTSRLMLTHAYYDVELWENLLKEKMTERRIIDTSREGCFPKFCCVSTTVTEEAIDAHVFRNYALPWNVESIYHGSHTAMLWEVVRCSSAAPTYFGDFIYNNQVHQDGGVLYNNPSCVAIHEAKLLWPNQKLCLVSFGTGRSPNKKKIDSQKLYLQNQVSSLFKDEPNGSVQTSSWKTKFMRILDAATDTEQAHHILSDLMQPGSYFRFNPYLTEMIPMTECNPEKWKQLERDALMYYRRNEHKFEELAETLLKPRSSISTFNELFFKNFNS